MSVLALISFGAVFGYSRPWNKDGVSVREVASKTAPVGIAALLFFVLGTATLAYFQPPREYRATSAPPLAGAEWRRIMRQEAERQESKAAIPGSAVRVLSLQSQKNLNCFSTFALSRLLNVKS
jgi:hypothetical protein